MAKKFVSCDNIKTLLSSVKNYIDSKNKIEIGSNSGQCITSVEKDGDTLKFNKGNLFVLDELNNIHIDGKSYKLLSEDEYKKIIHFVNLYNESFSSSNIPDNKVKVLYTEISVDDDENEKIDKSEWYQYFGSKIIDDELYYIWQKVEENLAVNYYILTDTYINLDSASLEHPIEPVGYICDDEIMSNYDGDNIVGVDSKDFVKSELEVL